jgi:hypothetical protein
VQCKRYTNSVVKHNDVHQLLGIMHTEGATRAIFINSGEYSRHALRKLQGIQNFEMIDGVQLREMIGPQLRDIEEHISPLDDPYREIIHGSRVEKQRRLAERAADRLVDRSIPYSRTRVPRSDALDFGLLLRVVAAVIVLLVLNRCNKYFNGQARPNVSVQQTARPPLAASETISPGKRSVLSATQRAPDNSTEVAQPAYMPHRPTAAEIRESQRKADEAIKVLAPNVPEM